MTTFQALLKRLRDALIAHIPPEPPSLPTVTVREEVPEPLRPIPPEWTRKDTTVLLESLSPMMQSALSGLTEARRRALRECLESPMIVTSGMEGKPGDGVHSLASLHYKGLAVDVSVMDFTRAFASHAKRILGDEYDIIVEGVSHVHAEYDP